jgi:hypothetical protein
MALWQLTKYSLQQGTISIFNMEEMVCHLSCETTIHPLLMERFLLFLQNRMQFPPSPFLSSGNKFCAEGFSEIIDETSTQNGFLIPLETYALPFVHIGFQVKKLCIEYRLPSPPEVCHRQYFVLYDFEQDTSHLHVDAYVVMVL